MYKEEYDNIGIIYKYTSPTGKCYIGQTQFPRRRQGEHRKAAKQGKPGKFYNAIRKYGWDSFDYEVLFTVFEDDSKIKQTILDEKEMYYIEKYDSFKNGYNMTIGGNSYSGENHPSFGTHLTEEHKEKLKNSVSKEVSQYTKEGDYVQTFKSAADAALYFGTDCSSTILKVCKGLGQSAQGYQWRYGNSKENIGKFYKFKDTQIVYQYTLDGTLVKVWKSAMEAQSEKGYSAGNIWQVCNNKKKAYGKKNGPKFIWSYTELTNLNWQVPDSPNN